MIGGAFMGIMDGELSDEELGAIGGGTLPYEESLRAELDRLNKEMARPVITESEREKIRLDLEALKEKLNEFIVSKTGGMKM